MYIIHKIIVGEGYFQEIIFYELYIYFVYSN